MLQSKSFKLYIRTEQVTDCPHPCWISEQLDQPSVVAGGGHQGAVRAAVGGVNVREVVLGSPDAGQAGAQDAGLRVPVQQGLHGTGNQLSPAARTVVVQQLSGS